MLVKCHFVRKEKSYAEDLNDIYPIVEMTSCEN